jgi:hypothetical protein
MTPRSGWRAGGRPRTTPRSPGSAGTCSRRGTWPGTCSTRSCTCARAPGWGGFRWWPGDGVKIAANAPEEASRTEAGLRKLAGQVIAGARNAAADEDADKGVLPGTDLLLGQDTAPGPDPRSRAGRVLACLEDLQGEREAAEAAAREQGQAYLQALAAGTVTGRPPAAVALAAARLRLEEAIAAGQATLAGWQARRAAGQRVTRPPVRPGTGKKARGARARLAELQAEAAAEADGQATVDGDAEHKPCRNVTDPDSRLLPVRGDGFIQGYNCRHAEPVSLDATWCTPGPILGFRVSGRPGSSAGTHLVLI